MSVGTWQRSGSGVGLRLALRSGFENSPSGSALTGSQALPLLAGWGQGGKQTGLLAQPSFCWHYVSHPGHHHTHGGARRWTFMVLSLGMGLAPRPHGSNYSSSQVGHTAWDLPSLSVSSVQTAIWPFFQKHRFCQISSSLWSLWKEVDKLGTDQVADIFLHINLILTTLLGFILHSVDEAT